MPTECAVLSPCGRYRVHFTSDDVGELRVAVDSHSPRGSAPPIESLTPSRSLSSPCGRAAHAKALHRYTAVLHESDVLALTTAAGVRKSFAKFAEMMYHALIGRASCVCFHVETCAEMKQRISTDVRRRQQRGGKAESPRAAAAHTVGGPGDETTVIDLSMSTDLAGDILSQRFLTLDYDVDFTRAVFPIPLDPAPVATTAPGTHPISAAPAQAACDGCATAPSSAQMASLQRELAAASDAMEQLRRENETLREENRTLARLSKEKMLEMQRLCEDFQARVQDAAEVHRLRARNAELRARLQEAEAAAQRALASAKQSSQRPSPSRGSTRGAGGSPNPYLRSLSRGSAAGAAPRAHPRDRPLVSPTPPPSRTRRSVDGGGGNRFDTPPTAGRPRFPLRSPSQGRVGGGGGDSPAPRGRSGNRAWVEASAPRKRGSPGPSACGSSRASSVASSRPQSCGSHERLYITSTAASRQRQVGPAVASLEPPRGRPVFR